MSTGTAEATAEAEIRALMENWLSAFRAQDIKGIVSHCAPDILAFDAVSQLQFKGKQGVRKALGSVSCHVSWPDERRDSRPEDCGRRQRGF